MKLNKNSIAKKVVVLFSIIITLLLVYTIFAETPEEEKARLEQELSDLETQLSQIDNGTWVNFSCSVSGVYYDNYNCDNQTGYHTVKVLTPGKHHQQFNFSNQIAYANNFAYEQTT